jgi:hypothetical protein
MTNDVFLDGGLIVNISTKQLRIRLSLPKAKPTPYNLRMADQRTTKPIYLYKRMGFFSVLNMCVCVCVCVRLISYWLENSG